MFALRHRPNNCVDDDRYGSICDQAVDRILRDCGVTENDRFLDIGSGIGQVVMQAAACVGCHAVVSAFLNCFFVVKVLCFPAVFPHVSLQISRYKLL